MVVSILVLIVENAPPQLRGRLSLWLFEVRAGVFVGDCSAKLREWIWSCVRQNIRDGNALIIWSTSKKEFGFNVDSCGDSRRSICEIDGIKMMKFIS